MGNISHCWGGGGGWSGMYLRLDGEERPDWMCRGQLTPVGHTWGCTLVLHTLHLRLSLSLLPPTGRKADYEM